ncbi:hypothetical protein H8E88_29480 [candidate division KSB1 bacterium]|nr:hypothetical protein [candidate division KSB1 bacterium]
MKTLIIISLVLAVALLFVSLSFAAWNEGGFKNSPLFKHSLKNSVESMENQGNEVASGGESGDTRDAKCNNPRAPETASPPCDTWEDTCEGEPTCYMGTCSGYTCTSPTCSGTCYGNTCSGATCSGATCQNTCANTCENTCSNCPLTVDGTVRHNAYGYWSNAWISGGVHIVQSQSYPYTYVNFNTSNGYYFCDEWGTPRQIIFAIGDLGSLRFWDMRIKQSQSQSSHLVLDFYCILQY